MERKQISTANLYVRYTFMNEQYAERMNDQAIEQFMEGISDLLLISDAIYSVCHADPGTLSDDDINEVEELISISDDVSNVEEIITND